MMLFVSLSALPPAVQSVLCCDCHCFCYGSYLLDISRLSPYRTPALRYGVRECALSGTSGTETHCPFCPGSIQSARPLARVAILADLLLLFFAGATLIRCSVLIVYTVSLECFSARSILSPSRLFILRLSVPGSLGPTPGLALRTSRSPCEYSPLRLSLSLSRPSPRLLPLLSAPTLPLPLLSSTCPIIISQQWRRRQSRRRQTGTIARPPPRGIHCALLSCSRLLLLMRGSGLAAHEGGLMLPQSTPTSPRPRPFLPVEYHLHRLLSFVAASDHPHSLLRCCPCDV